MVMDPMVTPLMQVLVLPPRLSLLDRGFIFAIAHIRGGQELGRQWYEDGKIFNKLNTFYDFIDVTKGYESLDWEIRKGSMREVEVQADCSWEQ